ncbi:MAG: DUF2851 family protein [Chitinophagaceae bacterium]|nr:DUF2851 family protein [Chitinophagaceae bacterium]
MNERLLQFIWKHKLWQTQKQLYTTEGKAMWVLHTGSLNQDAGPDFNHARIKIIDTTWAGSIELHLKSSDWKKHQHQHDPKYNKLILHVVYEDDDQILTHDGSYFPTLELRNYLDIQIIDTYYAMMNQVQSIPCKPFLSGIPEIILHQQLDKMLIERLEHKIEHIHKLLSTHTQHLEEICYIYLARGFGLLINQDNFERLASLTPLKLFSKHATLFQIEALLFGQAGFLNENTTNEYHQSLSKEYNHLKKLHKLEGMQLHEWKFLRLRPSSFPTIRIALLAKLIFQSSHLFSAILHAKNMKELKLIFTIQASPFWDTHYKFDHSSTHKEKQIGQSFFNSLLINTIIPLLFVYGKIQARESICSHALQLLKDIKAEKNALVDMMRQEGFNITDAADSQAAIQLKKEYCDRKRCLQCAIGYKVLRN